MKLDPERLAQLYGGDISDYYPEVRKNIEKKETSVEQDFKNLNDIYDNLIKKNQNSFLNKFKI